jgi:cyclopropane fatty-acyl-phospholipid synthase-like methyltransferase
MVFGIPQIPGIDAYEFVLWLVEQLPYVIAINVVLLAIVQKRMRIPVLCAFPITIAVLVTATMMGSYETARLQGFDVVNQPSIREALESYIESGNGDLNDILESGKYHATFGKFEMRYLIQDLLSHTFLHLDSHNSGNIPVAYNKGNDWFRATLGEPMVYTSGIYKKGDETLMEAQLYKLDYVANAIELKKGDKVLDIGCGWGRLVQHLTDKYGAQVTGVTLSSEQKKYADELNKGNGGKVFLQDAMKLHERKDIVPVGGFDAITSLEMAEHVGIKRYQEFLTKVHALLKDDGVLYFQFAGLRRQWHFEDFVWGLFMGEHVFPGADASCPIGWVSTQLERAGFEVQRVSNLGTHYSKTLAQWLDEWHLNKAKMIKTYGEKAYRRWEVFLAWSVRIARQGSSTVFMITATKQGKEKTRIRSQAHLVPKL